MSVLVKMVRLKVMLKASFCHQALPCENDMLLMSLSFGFFKGEGLVWLIPDHIACPRFIETGKAKTRPMASGMEAEGAGWHCWVGAAWHFWKVADQPRR